MRECFVEVIQSIVFYEGPSCERLQIVSRFNFHDCHSASESVVRPFQIISGEDFIHHSRIADGALYHVEEMIGGIVLSFLITLDIYRECEALSYLDDGNLVTSYMSAQCHQGNS